MNETIPTNPTPTAVPWTPDMMTPQTPVPNAVPAAPQAQPHAQAHMQAQMQPAPHQTTPHYQPPQPEYAQQMPHTHAPQVQNHVPQPQAYAPQPQAHMPQSAAPQAQATPYVSAAQPQHSGHPQHSGSPQHAPVLQPVHHRQQSAPPQMAQAVAAVSPHMAGQPAYAPPQQAQYAQPAPPPPLPTALAPQMQTAAQAGLAAAPEKSKSLLANLLKRSPKPAKVDISELPAPSGSLFNKNFVLGTVLGIVIGGLVLPKALSILGGGTPAQAQAQTQAQAESSPEVAPPLTSSEGEAFIDQAIATQTP